MYGVAEYLMSLQEGEKARLDRQVQQVDQNEGTRQPPPDEEWATKEEERDG
jgi:hypothetical protein